MTWVEIVEAVAKSLVGLGVGIAVGLLIRTAWVARQAYRETTMEQPKD